MIFTVILFIIMNKLIWKKDEKSFENDWGEYSFFKISKKIKKPYLDEYDKDFTSAFNIAK